jgi:hypothetical protein
MQAVFDSSTQTLASALGETSIAQTNSTPVASLVAKPQSEGNLIDTTMILPLLDRQML